jgi:Zn-dependent protease
MVAWIVVGVAAVVLLVRSGHISTFAFLMVLTLVPSVILHELAHGWAAQAFGDDTPARAGRLTANPVPAIDPFGTVVIPILLALTTLGVVGWAKPMPWNANRVRHHALFVTLVGPGLNIALAVFFGIVYRYVIPFHDKLAFAVPVPGTFVAQFVFVAGYVNAILALVNLIPLPPLDGSAVVDRMLPAHAVESYHRIAPFTMFIPLVILIFVPSAYDTIFAHIINEWARLVGIG